MKTKVQKSRIHGKGLFADEDIDSGEFLDYAKFRIAKRDNRFVGHWNDENLEMLDDWKYLNHSSNPNVTIVFSPVTRDLHVFSCRPIRRNDELTLHYGEDWMHDE